jgi:TolB-like protein
VPAMIEPCERPIMFELTQTADLSRWTGDEADRTWRAFVADIRRFVGAGPSESIAQGPAPMPAAAAVPTSRDYRPSLAILPFTNRSGDKTDDVFADGMVEDLISALTASSNIKVIAQSATIVYRRNVSDVRTIGRELGVRYLLEGNVRRLGASLRVTAQLVEAANGAILWSQKFDRALADLADLQELLVTEVAGNLGVQVERAEMEQALKKPGELTAWEAVMKSRASTERATRDSMSTAIIEARAAIDIAPEYAMAQATLAYALGGFYFTWTGGHDEEMGREARVHARRALALDANNATVLALSAVALGFSGSWQDALTYAQRALELNPNFALPHQALALAYIRFNKPDEAIRHLDAEIVLAPRGYMMYLNSSHRGIAHFQAGRTEQALQATDHALVLYPGFMWALKDKAVYCEKLGQHEDALEVVRQLRSGDRSVTLEEIEAANLAGFIAPETGAELNAVFRKLWLETAAEPSRK